MRRGPRLLTLYHTTITPEVPSVILLVVRVAVRGRSIFYLGATIAAIVCRSYCVQARSSWIRREQAVLAATLLV